VNNSLTLRRNTRLAKRTWNVMSSEALRRLKDLTIAYDLSIAAGHLLFLNNNWYVTHAGLLYIAAQRHCHGMHVTPRRTAMPFSASSTATGPAMRKKVSRETPDPRLEPDRPDVH